MKPSKNILIDLFTLTSFIFVAVSGFGMHITGHGNSHALWHGWAVFHVVSAILFITCVTFHIKGHWAWYKSLFSTGIGKKSRITIILTVLMLAVTLSGIIVMLLSDHNENHIGLWHYVIGIIFTLTALGHFIKRHNILFKGLRNQS